MIKSYDGSFILFDWGAARIDVPLCDIMALETKISSDAMEEYLKLWEKLRLIWVLKNYEHEARSGRVTWLEGIVVNMLEGLLEDAIEHVEERNRRASDL
ncbi:hypothetical protein FGB62_30g319 [Gracilaria domingensis]|nr:hypothetical protein FGB62_30g319 [Gracilaria domingensis]